MSIQREYRRIQQRDARLAVLRLTAEGDGTSNLSLLRRGLVGFGLSFSRPEVRDVLDWLAERKFLRLSEAGDVIVAAITEDGRAIVRGMATHPDITIPSSMAD